VRDRAVTPKAAGSTFSMTSEAEHLVRFRKWLRLRALQDDVRGIFELTRLVRAMSIHLTRQEALASWR
jgi:predicted RNA binding protein with dsRBD fold (UPF0201 family)